MCLKDAVVFGNLLEHDSLNIYNNIDNICKTLNINNNNHNNTNHNDTIYNNHNNINKNKTK